MKRREFLKLMAAATASAAHGALPGCGEGQEPRAPRRRPNIIFVLADQFRADLVGLYGGGQVIETTHLDALGRQGMVFDNALSTYPVCTPYRGMLMTGRGPSHTGIVVNRVDVSPDHNRECLANVFSEAGYDTGYIGKWHLSPGLRRTDGKFERDNEAVRLYKQSHPEAEFIPPGPRRLGFEHWEAYNYHEDFNDYWFYRDEPKRIHVEGFETDIQFDQAIAYLKAHRPRPDPQASGQPGGQSAGQPDGQAEARPFFLVVSPHPPHPPLAPEFLPPGYLEQVPEHIPSRPNRPGAIEGNALLKMRAYHAMAKNLDDNLGRLTRALDELGMAQDTLLVFTADHGAMNGSHGLTNKMAPFSESLDVPLLMRWPGVIPAGQRTAALQTPLDHLPTLAGLAGIQAPSQAQGLDLSAVARGEAGVASSPSARDDALIMNFVSHWTYFQSGTRMPEWRGIRTRRHSYVRYLGGTELLFDNQADPYQLRNLVGEPREAKLLAHLRTRLSARLAEVHDEFLPGTAYADWYDDQRNLVRNALGAL